MLLRQKSQALFHSLQYSGLKKCYVGRSAKWSAKKCCTPRSDFIFFCAPQSALRVFGLALRSAERKTGALMPTSACLWDARHWSPLQGKHLMCLSFQRHLLFNLRGKSMKTIYTDRIIWVYVGINSQSNDNILQQQQSPTTTRLESITAL